MGDYNNPKWLDKEFLEYALSTDDDKAEVISFQPRIGVPPGTNYCSDIYKIQVQYKMKKDGEIKEICLFVKDPVGGHLLNMMKEGRFVEKELMAYSDLFPLFRKYKSGVEITVRNFPTKVENLLVLQCLEGEGYRMFDKRIQLGFRHATVAIELLAKFHALSVAVHHERPEVIESLAVAHAYEKRTTEAYVFAKNNCLELADVVGSWKGYERFGDMIRKAWETYDERFDKAYFLKSKVLNVLNHGDPWCGNMLIQEDATGCPISAKIIDLSSLHYGSIGIDMNIFIFTSIKYNIREARYDDLVAKYLAKLNATLAECGCKERMNREEFDQEMKNTAMNALYAIYITSYYMYSNYEELDENKQNINVYDRKVFRDNTIAVLKHLDKMGYK